MADTNPLPYDTAPDFSMAKLVRNGLRWVAKNVLWLSLGIGLGGIAGFAYFELTPIIYTSRMIGHANDMDDLRVRELIADLQLLRTTNDLARFAEELRFPIEQARKVKSIACLPNNALEADLPAYPGRDAKVYFFAMDVQCTEPALFPKIQDAIIGYVDRQPFVKSVLNMNLRNFDQRMETMREEMDYLKKVQQNIVEHPGQSGTIDPGSLSIHMVNIEEKLRELEYSRRRYEHELVITKPLQVVRKPSSMGYYRCTLNGALIGLMLVLIGLLSGSVRRFVAQD